MSEYAGIEAQLAWLLLFSNEDGSLRESSVVDYAGMLDGMEAAELLALVRAAQRRLVKMGVQNEADAQAPVELYIDKSFCIRMGGPAGTQIPFRPLVRAVFILFLKHPEGILLKDRARFQKDLEDIYKVIAPEIKFLYVEQTVTIGLIGAEKLVPGIVKLIKRSSYGSCRGVSVLKPFILIHSDLPGKLTILYIE